MENLSTVKKSDTLPKVQTFLPDKKLVLEKNVSFCAFRAGEYFTIKKNIFRSISGKYSSGI